MQIPVSTIIREAFEKWLSFPDYDIVDIVAATVIANRLQGEPMWLAIVGPSGSGKTEVVRALKGVERVHCLDRITPATFVSGYREQGKKKKGAKEQYGLLAEMCDGKPHILVIEDFSTIFGKRRDTKGEVLADFRKLYDGEYVAPFGNDVHFEWKGKVGVIACSTGVYDREMGSQSQFGDRFLVVRNVSGSAVHTAERAGRNSSESGKMREELKAAFQKLDEIKLPKVSPPLSLDARSLISKLTAFVARSRTVVPRDNFKREVEALPEIEGTGRMSSQLHQLLRALVIYREREVVTEEDIETVERVAFGTIPSLRLRVMRQMNPRGGVGASAIKGVPRTQLHRVVEDLQLLELIEWKSVGGPTGRTGVYEVVEEWRPFFAHLKAKAQSLGF